ncbi:MAG TPA: tripartite tricarboxylate transporter substrate binding protein, partial [Pseudolabrys sp.]|nr:tripartite tricarboxylate transporter substrate binding protein [Pseudolabrys sp.]
MPRFRFFTNAIAAVAISVYAIGILPAPAQPYPARDITFVVAFAPGGVADTVARLVGQGVSARLARNVVVENRGGAGGN